MHAQMASGCSNQFASYINKGGLQLNVHLHQLLLVSFIVQKKLQEVADGDVDVYAKNVRTNLPVISTGARPTTQLPAKCAFTSTTLCEFHFCIMALSIFFIFCHKITHVPGRFYGCYAKMLEPICDLSTGGCDLCLRNGFS